MKRKHLYTIAAAFGFAFLAVPAVSAYADESDELETAETPTAEVYATSTAEEVAEPAAQAEEGGSTEEEVSDRDLDTEKAEFLETLTEDGYAEVGRYSVTLIKDNVYHMDEETEALAGGDSDEYGMNNPSSIYFVVEDDQLLVVDGGNQPSLVNYDKLLDAKVILEALAADKQVNFVFTHGHVDHVGLVWDKEVIENLNLGTLYINEADYVDRAENSLTAKTALSGLEDKIVFYSDGDVVTIGDRTYTIVGLPGHTDGSVAIVDVEKEVIFSGDGMGSGFVWLFWSNIENPIGRMEEGIKNLQALVADMENPTFLCGHRWQQFWEQNPEKPDEITAQYLQDMLDVISGLVDDSSDINSYAIRGKDTDLEVSRTGAHAKIDTTQEIIDIYLASLEEEPEEPETPDTPEVPEKPERPEKPGKPAHKPAKPAEAAVTTTASVDTGVEFAFAGYAALVPAALGSAAVVLKKRRK